jgi:hypothetical protein
MVKTLTLYGPLRKQSELLHLSHSSRYRGRLVGDVRDSAFEPRRVHSFWVGLFFLGEGLDGVSFWGHGDRKRSNFESNK